MIVAANPREIDALGSPHQRWTSVFAALFSYGCFPVLSQLTIICHIKRSDINVIFMVAPSPGKVQSIVDERQSRCGLAMRSLRECVFVRPVETIRRGNNIDALLMVNPGQKKPPFAIDNRGPRAFETTLICQFMLFIKGF